MDKVRHCQGMVKTPNGDMRPCEKSGNTVLANGYCIQHQYFAVGRLLEQLKSVEITLVRLENDGVDKEKIREAKQQIKRVKKQLDEAQRICSEDHDCSIGLRDILVSLQRIREHDPSSSNDLISRINDISKLAVAGRPEDAEAFQISREYELARQRHEENEKVIMELETALQDTASKAETQERLFQRSLQTLNEDLRSNAVGKQESEQIVSSLRKQLDRQQGEAKQAAGVYATTLQSIEADTDKYKNLYNNMVGREIRVGKSVEQLSRNEKELQKAIEALKLSYEKKLSTLRNEYAEIVSKGGTVLSEREAELQEQVEQLKSDLQSAMEHLKYATETGKEALNQAIRTHLPYGQLAQELLDTSNRLREKNEELAELQRMHDRKVAEFAEAELNVAQKIDQATARDRSEIQRLSEELMNSERKLMNIQQEVVQLQSNTYNLRKEHENDLQIMSNKLKEAQNQLLQVRAAKDADKRNIASQISLIQNQVRAQNLEKDAKLNQIRREMQQDYDTKLRVLQEKYQANQQLLIQERNSLQNAQKQIAAHFQSLKQQKETLDAYRTNYEERMAEFNAQKEELQSKLMHSNEQANQFNQIENDYKKRVEILQQTINLDRQRYETQIQDLSNKLNQAITNRTQLNYTLEQCAAAREAVTIKVNQLTEQNMQLRDDFQKMKAEKDMLQARFQASMDKLRTDEAKMMSDLKVCRQALQDMTLAHEDAKRMVDEAQRIRRGLEATVLKFQGSQQAAQRLLRDNELKQNEIDRLQMALKDCDLQRSQAKVVLSNTNSELRDMKQINQELTANIRGLSEQYQSALDQREAVMSQAALKSQVEEDSLKRQLLEVANRSNNQSSMIDKLQKQRQMLSDSLANTEFERARQIELLLKSEQVTGRPGARGRSSLLKE